MIRDEHDSKLGALLRYAEVLDELSIKRGLLLSSYTGLPLGRCLVLLGSAHPEAVKGAVQLQSILREELVSLETARAALTLMVKQNWSLTEAFSALSVDCGLVSRNRMGELLTESGMVNQRELELALYANEHSGLPLGYAIGLLGKSSPGKLKYALTIQRSIRAGTISRRDGIIALRAIKDECLEGDFDRNALFSPLAKLLVNSGIVRQADLDSAYRRCARSDSMTALDLIDNDLVSPDLLVATIRIREIVLSGSLTQEAAEKMLAKCACSVRETNLLMASTRAMCLEDFLKVLGYLNSERLKGLFDEVMRTPELSAQIVNHLIRTRFVTYSNSEEAISIAFRNNSTLRELLSNCSSLDRKVIDSAILFYELYSEGRLKLEQAVLNFTIQAELSAHPQLRDAV